jgi:predicted nucleotide-binding protein
MTYYHISILWSKVYHYERDRDEGAVRVISENYNGGKKFLFDGRWMSPNDIEAIHIFATESPSEKSLVSVFSLHKKEVTRNWIYKSPQTVPDDKSKQPQETPRKGVFIVHGRDHEPMKELKTMLFEFGLHPIVLHEQPSGSRTIVEKLEKYSDVGYVFIILTPDDLGISKNEIPIKNKDTLGPFVIATRKDLIIPLENLKSRARQNVVLEFGYFMGLLGRDRVCCLYKGDVELPSDMHGIVYIPFKDSIEEIRLKIMKELKEAGYEIKI